MINFVKSEKFVTISAEELTEIIKMSADQMTDQSRVKSLITPQSSVFTIDFEDRLSRFIFRIDTNPDGGCTLTLELETVDPDASNNVSEIGFEDVFK